MGASAIVGPVPDGWGLAEAFHYTMGGPAALVGVTSIVAKLVQSRWGRATLLVGLLLISALVVLPLAFRFHGWNGALSAGVALGVCLAGGLLSLWLAHLFHDPEQVMHQVLLGMLPRMGLPLVACMIAILQRGMLAESGFVYYIMAYYFVTWAAETVLVARRFPEASNETHAG